MILLTAIERIREESLTVEEQPAEKRSTANARKVPKEIDAVMQIREEAWTERGRHMGSKQWISGLQIAGKLQLQAFYLNCNITFSEAKILPTCVLLVSLAYSGVAVCLYF